MNEANIEYRVRGPINTQLQLNRHCKQIVIAAQLISAKNFEKRADRMLHLSPGAVLEMQHAVADLLGSTLVPELGADVAARTTGDVHLLLVTIAAIGALPH